MHIKIPYTNASEDFNHAMFVFPEKKVKYFVYTLVLLEIRQDNLHRNKLIRSAVMETRL